MFDLLTRMKSISYTHRHRHACTQTQTDTHTDRQGFTGEAKEKNNFSLQENNYFYLHIVSSTKEPTEDNSVLKKLRGMIS